MRKGFLSYIFAVALIALGIILILENIGIAAFNAKETWLVIYPTLFVLLGIKWMIDRIRHKGGSWVFGSFFFIFGSLLLLDRFDVIQFVFKDIFKLWPLLIVYFGFMFINSNRSGNVIIHTSDGKSKKKYYNNGSYFTVGSHEYNEPNWKVEPMNLSNLAGDFYLDFTKAYIPEKEIPINIKALAGDVHLLIPENLEFRIYASVKAGDIDVIGQSVDGINRTLSYETERYEEAERKLDLNITLKAGSIRVDYV
ncbi:cell wall-active antibiotics response protein LiaF [Ornithinibacillus halophilus]|uniref:Lia operon protein LiaF n=1 Tax=Ornithinibacillus halophilus TaxID=930117 RepID=A0A1M5M8N8_9BACI|nr:cell wall-active antibiotics response protein LiaF [Ornithinibacillus halophilus]SHG73588.1 lia operon protein LiaF [Ornithinibacillus halophilus]